MPSRRYRLARSLGVLGVLVLVAVVGLVASRPHREPRAGGTVTPAVHFTVGLESCTFTDASRETYNYYLGKETPGRVIPTEIFYPTISGTPGLAETPNAHPAVRHGPYPVIVFAEGYDVSPGTYAPLLNAWVRSGFVVVAPRFPDTDAAAVMAQHGDLTEADDINQPGDVAFVTKQVEQDDASASPTCPLLHRLVVTDDIALAGQSDGATTVAGLAYDRSYASGVSFRAVASLSGQAFGAGTAKGPVSYGAGPPLLVVQSATDQCNPPQFSTQLYSLVPQSDRWFLELRNAYHLPPYSGTNPSAFNVVAAVTTRFFRLELSGSTPGRGFISYGDRSPSVGVLTTSAAPALAPLSQSAAACYYGE